MDDRGSNFPGAHCDPHRVGADRQNPETEDPCDLGPGRRRRFATRFGAYRLYLRGGGPIVTANPSNGAEDRSRNLTATSCERDDHMTTEIAATKEGRESRVCASRDRDHGAFDVRRSVEMAGLRLLSHIVTVL